MKNQKRLYEAEQANAEEQRKLKELHQEIQNERNFEELKRIGQSSGVLAADNSKGKLEWMYKGAENALNREEYLTGRSIDQHFEQQNAFEREKEKSNLVGVTVPKNHVEHECIPFSIRAFKAAPVVNYYLNHNDIFIGYIKLYSYFSFLFPIFRVKNKWICNEKSWKIR